VQESINGIDTDIKCLFTPRAASWQVETLNTRTGLGQRVSTVTVIFSHLQTNAYCRPLLPLPQPICRHHALYLSFSTSQRLTCHLSACFFIFPFWFDVQPPKKRQNREKDDRDLKRHADKTVLAAVVHQFGYGALISFYHPDY